MLVGKINVTLIDKARLFQGAKGKYLDFVVFELDEPDRFGNTHIIQQSVSKEERAKGVKGTPIGSAKVIETRRAPPPGTRPEPPQTRSAKPPAQAEASFQDDVPF